MWRHGMYCIRYILSTLCNPRIFWVLAYIEPETYLKPYEKLTRYIQNPARALFSHFQTYSERCATLAYAETWDTQNPGMFRTFPYCILMHIQNPVIFTKIYECSWTLTYLKSDTYAEPSQRFKMEFFFKNSWKL